MRKTLWILLAALVLFTTPLPILPQANIVSSIVQRTYSTGFSIACAGAGDCVGIHLTAASSYTTIRELWISQPSSNVVVSLIRRSALDTGGTKSTMTLVKSDTNDGAANTLVDAYTAVPTPGTAVGTMLMVPVSTTSTLIRDSTISNYKAVILQGTTQEFAISVDGAATITVNIVVTESQ
jgi:hypothetical protein